METVEKAIFTLKPSKCDYLGLVSQLSTFCVNIFLLLHLSAYKIFNSHIIWS